MGKYTITHTCGHNAQHQLFGKEEARERTLAWRAKGICPICYAAEQSANVDAASADLPELTGSEKQVAWARKIRVKVLKQVDDFAAQHKVKADKWQPLEMHSPAKHPGRGGSTAKQLACQT